MNAKKSKNSLIFLPGSKINAENTPENLENFKENLKKHDSIKTVVLDLKNVETIDPSGISLLAGLQKELKQNNIELSVKNPDSEISKLLRFSGFAEINI